MDIKFDELKDALKSQEIKLDIISNNLSNVGTTGYKGNLVFVELMEIEGKQLSNVKVKLNFKEGAIERTDNPLDFAINGRGLFAVQTESGEEKYTRNGHFTVDSDGFLKTSDGYFVLGKGGPINVTIDGVKPGKVEVSQSGEIYVDGDYIDDFLIVDIDDYGLLEREANGYYVANNVDVVELENPIVTQGALESSNVNPIKEMINLITVQRYFESTQKALKSVDDQLKKAANNIGKYKT
ncbi:MAG: flagellar hook-basal body complex protein [Candidatus Marinimicrobia bacterium]|nr:flagellar hook-basal body complex protein [Candidatus Neomarinimicrobiota bacterium]